MESNTPSGFSPVFHLNFQEAVNYETMICCSGRGEKAIEPLFESLGTAIDLTQPLTARPNAYAKVLDKPAAALLETYCRVHARFLRLEPSDCIVKRGDILYPASVAKESDSPRFIYARGDLSLLSRRIVCVVGTRNPSDEGKQYAQLTARALGAQGVVVASGLALGIDGIAQLTCLVKGFPTIAVIGTPLTESYPAQHVSIQREIGHKGLLITRFSPAAVTQKWFFLLRNHLMSSLSVASVIVEDRDGGGAVNQVGYALKQGRTVVLFKHVLENRSILWPRRLARENGSVVVEKTSEIPEVLFPRKALEGKGKTPVGLPGGDVDQLSLFDGQI